MYKYISNLILHIKKYVIILILKYLNYLVKRLILIFLAGLVLFSCTKSDTGVVLQSIYFSDHDTLVTINPGATMQLTPLFKPAVFNGIPVEFTSSDPAVVTVLPSGQVSAINRGKAWVTVKDQNSATAGKCHIVVQ